jgi:hypothetical protein
MGRDGVRRPRALATQVRHPGGIGAPPGTTRSPCQELAEGSVGAAMRDGPD